MATEAVATASVAMVPEFQSVNDGRSEMKKNILQYLFWTMTTCCVLMMPFFPHHHHGAEVCMMVEYCDEDHAVNDEHTQHHDSSGHCEVRNGLFAVRPELSVVHVPIQAMPMPAMAVEAWHIGETLRFECDWLPCLASLSLLSGKVRIHGLRAPPAFLS